MPRDPLRIAVFRLEQITVLLEPTLTPAERYQLAQAAARTPIPWPSGRVAPIPVSTLYRWLALYRAHLDLKSLLPRPRPACRRPAVILAAWVDYALALLEEEPERSLYILGCKLRDRFGLARVPSRASLHRALRRNPRYAALRRRAHGESRYRRRFQANAPHDLWQGDAKGKFRVRFADGTVREVTVLSFLDDNTRFIVAGLVVFEETAVAAILVFRRGAAIYGLPARFYADHGAAYDSWVFRKGLALLGVRRIPTKSRNPPARGKIEAYHRLLKRWFVRELRHQIVRDLAHLQELLDAYLDRIYHEHPHRELQHRTPRQALGEARSARIVSLERLRQAFLLERTLRVHPKDATVRIDGTLFRVPARAIPASRWVRVAVDPEHPGTPYLVLGPGRLEALPPAVHLCAPDPPRSPAAASDEPIGALTPLLERYRGRDLPLARAGFGLPEIYDAFARLLGRPVPTTEREASEVVEWLAQAGPFEPAPFHAALARVHGRLGDGRPLAQILRALAREVRPVPRKESP